MLRPLNLLKNALLLAALTAGLQVLAADAPAPGQATASTPQAPTAQQAAPCPQPDELQAADLYGLWRAEFEPQATPATVLGEVSPESCGREIKGTWTSETQPQKPLRFVLRKVAR